MNESDKNQLQGDINIILDDDRTTGVVVFRMTETGFALESYGGLINQLEECVKALASRLT